MVTGDPLKKQQKKSGISTNIGVFVPVKVKRIILDGTTDSSKTYGGYDAVGQIHFTIVKKGDQPGLYDPSDKENDETETFDGVARPLFPHIKYYPLVNEIVLIISTIGHKDHPRKTSPSHFYLI